jgi:hypothetical protein
VVLEYRASHQQFQRAVARASRSVGRRGGLQTVVPLTDSLTKYHDALCCRPCGRKSCYYRTCLITTTATWCNANAWCATSTTLRISNCTALIRVPPYRATSTEQCTCMNYTLSWISKSTCNECTSTYQRNTIPFNSRDRSAFDLYCWLV